MGGAGKLAGRRRPVNEANSMYEQLFDYAGVFPPANHELGEAIRRYRAAKAESDGWVLGPFLLRASQSKAADLDGIEFGLVMDIEPARAVRPSSALVQVETTLEDLRSPDLDALLDLAPIVYVESRHPPSLDMVAAISEARAKGHDVRAKIRTGGASAASFPAPSEAAAFIETCSKLRVPFKATAGLHHPFRHPSAVPAATEHGFVNLLAATRAALVGAGEVESILRETSPEAFDVEQAAWRGIGTTASPADVRWLLRSIGSCSFHEPAGYLHAIGALAGTS